MKETALTGFVVLSLLLSGCGTTSDLAVKQQSIWYEHENGMINLSATSQISGQMRAYAKKASGGGRTIYYGPITETEVLNMAEAMREYEKKVDEVEYVHARAYIKFDDLELDLQRLEGEAKNYSTEDYLKLAQLWLTEYETLRARLLDM